MNFNQLSESELIEFLLTDYSKDGLSSPVQLAEQIWNNLKNKSSTPLSTQDLWLATIYRGNFNQKFTEYDILHFSKDQVKELSIEFKFTPNDLEQDRSRLLRIFTHLKLIHYQGDKVLEPAIFMPLSHYLSLNDINNLRQAYQLKVFPFEITIQNNSTIIVKTILTEENCSLLNSLETSGIEMTVFGFVKNNDIEKAKMVIGMIVDLKSLEICHFLYTVLTMKDFCYSKRQEWAELLIDHKIGLHSHLFDGDPLLHILIIRDMRDLIYRSVEQGVDINSQNMNGLTPIMFLASKSIQGTGYLDVINYLAHAGADLTLKCNHGATILQYLLDDLKYLDKDVSQTVKLLVDKGAPLTNGSTNDLVSPIFSIFALCTKNSGENKFDLFKQILEEHGEIRFDDDEKSRILTYLSNTRESQLAKLVSERKTNNKS